MIKVSPAINHPPSLLPSSPSPFSYVRASPPLQSTHIKSNWEIEIQRPSEGLFRARALGTIKQLRTLATNTQHVVNPRESPG